MNGNQKNLLVVYLDFPRDPAQSFPALILKYLAKLGWDVTIATIEPGGKVGQRWEEWGGVRFLRITPPVNLVSSLSLRLESRRFSDMAALRLRDAAGEKATAGVSVYSGAGMFLAWGNSLVNAFGKYYHFSSHVEHTLLRIHAHMPFSAVMSVYNGPFASHIVARRFARRTGKPWIALVKDYWGIPYSRGDLRGAESKTAPFVFRELHKLKHAFRSRVEARVLSDASFLLPHCQPVADHLRTLAPGVPMRVLPNCYDDEDFGDNASAPGAGCNGLYDLVCLGTPASMDKYDMLFRALRDLYASGTVTKDGFRVRFVSSTPDLMRSYAKAYSCADIVESLSQVGHAEAMSLLKSANGLLFPQRGGSLPRRTPEYLAARKPILAFPRLDSCPSQQTLDRYGAAFIARDSEEIAATLSDWYQGFKAGKRVVGPIQEAVVQAFKASNRAKELQGVLERVSPGRLQQGPRRLQ